MNIGFIINFNKQDWIGGYNYYLHLFNGLKNRKNSKFKPVIILDNKNRLLNNKELKKFDYIISDLFSNKSSLQRIIK